MFRREIVKRLGLADGELDDEIIPGRDSDGEFDSSVSDDMDILSHEMQEILCLAQHAAGKCKELEVLAEKATPDEKAELAEARESMSEQATRFRALLMAADSRWDATRLPNPPDPLKQLQGARIVSKHLASKIARIFKEDISDSTECDSVEEEATLSLTCPAEDSTCEEEAAASLETGDVGPRPSQVEVQQEIRLVLRSEIEDEAYVSVASAVTTIPAVPEPAPEDDAGDDGGRPSQLVRGRKGGEREDPCGAALGRYARHERAHGAEVNFRLPLNVNDEEARREVDVDPACEDAEQERRPGEEEEREEDVCRIPNDLPEGSSYPWPGGLRQIFPYECTARTEQRVETTTMAATAAARQRRRRAAHRRRARICDIPEFCPTPSGPCSREASEPASGDGYTEGFACPPFTGYSPFNFCFADVFRRFPRGGLRDPLEPEEAGRDPEVDGRGEEGEDDGTNVRKDPC